MSDSTANLSGCPVCRRTIRERSTGMIKKSFRREDPFRLLIECLGCGAQLERTIGGVPRQDAGWILRPPEHDLDA